MARANTVMSTGPTACSQAPHKIASWCCCTKAVSWAPLAPAGGPGLIANEIPIMHVPTRPDTAAHTAALLVNMRVPFRDGSIRVSNKQDARNRRMPWTPTGLVSDPGCGRSFATVLGPPHSPLYDVLPMAWQPEPE